MFDTERHVSALSYCVSDTVTCSIPVLWHRRMVNPQGALAHALGCVHDHAHISMHVPATSASFANSRSHSPRTRRVHATMATFGAASLYMRLPQGLV